MTLGSLFAGIGGFELAAQWAGIEPIWSNEIDPFCCKVLRKNFNHEIIEKDIREIGKHNLKRVDIVSGGFPCQPFSQAGKRKGKADDRYLWPEMLRVIKELQPSYVIGENVAGLLSMENGETLKGILFGLEDAGYNNEIFLIPACGVGAWHRRERLWIICHSKSKRLERTNGVQKSKGFNKGCQDVSNPHSSRYIHGKSKEQPAKGGCEPQYKSTTSSKYENVSDTTSQRFRRGDLSSDSGNKSTDKQGGNKSRSKIEQYLRQWEFEPNVGRVAHGIPGRVDKLKSLGNAIVPQVAYELFKAIKAIKALIPNQAGI